MSKPWEVKGVSFNTESKFWQFVRSGLRGVWSKHQVKLKFVEAYRKKVPNPNPDGRVATVWGMTCCKCGNDYCLPVKREVKKKIEDHTGVPFNYIEINHKTEAGSLKSKEDLGRFAANLLYVVFDDLEAICKSCHSIVTYMAKENVDETTAILTKKAIALEKSKEDKAFIINSGLTPARNAKERRKQLIELLNKLGENIDDKKY